MLPFILAGDRLQEEIPIVECEPRRVERLSLGIVMTSNDNRPVKQMIIISILNIKQFV